MPELWQERPRRAGKTREARIAQLRGELDELRHREGIEHDGGVELLIRYAQLVNAEQAAAPDGTAAHLRYWRELSYRCGLLLEGDLGQLRQLLDALVREVAEARDAELEQQVRPPDLELDLEL